MSNFATMLKDENNKAKTLTENLAVAYETSGKYLLDFNFKLSQYRNMDTENIKNDFAKVFFEDSLIATKFVFFVGDVRGGLGERKVFRACIEWLADNKPEIMVYNKCDKLSSEDLNELKIKHQSGVFISARSNDGVVQLKEVIEKMMF